jgi:hypothetical protein
LSLSRVLCDHAAAGLANQRPRHFSFIPQIISLTNFFSVDSTAEWKGKIARHRSRRRTVEVLLVELGKRLCKSDCGLPFDFGAVSCMDLRLVGDLINEVTAIP